MKKNVWIIATVLLLTGSTAAYLRASGAMEQSTVSKDGFKMKKDGTWAGNMDGKMYWYKLDKMAKLWWSTDGKTWAAVESGMWADKDGHWLKIGDGKLWWSADMGKTFAEVPEWKWQGPSGEWYKFDASWNLWINK